ncbi:transglycosylase domain-containing protein [Bacteroidales bacterium OttesenSCG-928-I14]|nr:transglycosylase domain-containing protein [Bacteroidales bacterium OttesenSCG-928-I14]
MPPIQDLENPIDKYASEVISVDLQNMGTYSVEKNNRIYVNYNELSPSLIQALVATEDARYEKHSGIDFYALARAIVKTGILRQESGGGASTISQQLAKQLYSEHAATKLERILQKPIEWVIAVQLERYYTKQEIINMYLNQYDFLYNAVGIQSASWVYFGKQPKDLKLEEAATLVGMCKNAILYNPRRFPERSLGRRNVVLDLMAKHDYITKQEADSLKETPLVLDYKKVDHNEGIAPYFREQLRITMTAKKPVRKNYQSWQMQKFKEDSIAWETNPLFGWCNKNKKQNGENYKLSTDGLKIYTTIDSRMQKYAEEAVAEHVAGTLQTAFYKEKTNASTAPFSRDISKKDLEAIMAKAMKVSDRYYQHKNVDKLSEEEITKIFNTPVEMNLFSYNGIIDTLMTPIDSIRYMKMFLRTGMMAMDTHTGAIKAYVGGTNYHNFKYDMVSTGKRQVGSTAKPFLYSLAMESGITPCDEVFHEPQKLLTETGSVWAPKNGRAALNANVSVRWGLQLSDNWVTAALMKQLSPYAFANLVQSYGLKNPVDPVVSSCLGPFDASVSEMVSAYSTFANGGISVEPIMVTRIEDRDGNVIASFAPNMHEVISEKASYQMLSMLESVINNGTGYRVRRDHGMTVPMGGKTGTTQRNSDAWFMCFTPSLVGGCWVGGEERSIHFNRMSEGQGAAAALPVMGKFLKKVYSDNNLGYSQSEKFEVPAQYSNPCPPTTSLLDVNYSGGTMAEEFQ